MLWPCRSLSSYQSRLINWSSFWLLNKLAYRIVHHVVFAGKWVTCTLHVPTVSTERNFIGAVERAGRTSIDTWASLLAITNQWARSYMQVASVFTDVPIARNKETLPQIFVGTPILTSVNPVYNWSTCSLHDDVVQNIRQFRKSKIFQTTWRIRTMTTSTTLTTLQIQELL